MSWVHAVSGSRKLNGLDPELYGIREEDALNHFVVAAFHPKEEQMLLAAM
jgi:hypothetical protein